MTTALKANRVHENAFNWQTQPAEIKLGRQKSKRQIVIDATRVNQEQYTCTSNQTKSKVAPR